MLFSNSICKLLRDIFIDTVKINVTQSAKFPGLHIDNKLSWNLHVDYLGNIVSRNLGLINRLKVFLPTNILLTLQNTLSLSYINYGILAWGNSSHSSIIRLLQLQKKLYV